VHVFRIFCISILLLASSIYANSINWLDKDIWVSTSTSVDASSIELDQVKDSFRVATPSDFNGFTNKPFWIKRKVTNPTAEEQLLVLELRNNFPDYVTAFYTDQHDQWRSRVLGSRQREFGDTPQPFIQFSIKANTTTEFFFHIHTQSILHFPMFVQEENDYLIELHKKSLGYGFFLGIQFFALFLGLINFVLYRHTNFGWYSGMILFGGLLPLYNNGYFSVLFPINFGSIDNTIIIALSYLYVLFNINFCLRFYSENNSSQPKNLIRFSYLFTFFALIAVINIPPYKYSIYLIQCLIPLTYFAHLYYALKWHKTANAAYTLTFLIAQFALLIGYSTAIFESLGFVPSNIFTLYLPELTSSIYSILVGSAITLRLNLQRSEERQKKIEIQEQHFHNLKKQEEELRGFLTHKKHFTHVISHNLRSPLSSLKGLLDLVHRLGPKEEFISRMDPLVNNMDHQLVELNELLQLEEKEIDLRPTDLKSVFDQVATAFNEKVISGTVQIKTNIDSSHVVLGNSALIHSVLFNLLDNSIKYRHPKRKCVVKINIATYKDHHYISFQDNGTGINYEKHSRRLFKLYERLTDQGEGSGKGLYLCQLQMRQMKGSIDLDPNQAIGCKFILKLQRV
jgi:signal transduction histidine kinase